MKKIIYTQALISTYLITPTLVLAQTTTSTTSGISQVQTFIQSVIQVLVTLAGLVAAGYFVWGGFGYITSSGNPEALSRSKRTITHSAIGLAIVLGAFVISNIVGQLAGAAFGSSTALK